jgi:uncharacterized tellurite resistance protein B-like protein
MEELIVGLITTAAIIFGTRFFFRGGAAVVKSSVRTAQGHGTFTENVESEWQGLGKLEIRQVPFHIGDNGEGPLAIGIELKGLIPITVPTNIGFSISAIDATGYDEASDKGSDPVLCVLEDMQEAETTAFQYRQAGPRVEPEHGWPHWTRVGSVVPEILIPAYSGRRDLMLVCRILDMDNLPVVHRGFCRSEQAGVIAEPYLRYTLDFKGKGYFEAAEDRDESRKLAIRLAMAIAMDDGELHDKEGYAIKHWVKRTLATYSEERQEYLKGVYNAAIRAGHAAASEGRVLIGDLTGQLKELADPAMKYEAVELCLDVMKADGSASAGEMRAIRNIAKSLELDYDEFERLKDRSILGIDTDQDSDTDALLGIQSDWTPEQTKKHLARLYAKWNSRVTSLPEGPDRETAQHMLDTIAAARTKYDN